MTHEPKARRGVYVRASVQREKAPRGPNVKSFRGKAKLHALEALEALATLAQGASSEAVRVSAANALLDRAYGKPLSGAPRPAARPGGEGQGGELEVRWLSDEDS